MNPTAHEAANVQLAAPAEIPLPASEVAGAAQARPEQGRAAVAEASPRGPIGAPAATAASPAPTIPLPLPTPAATSTDNSQVVAAAVAHMPNPSVADDRDLIEKEWVHKAKAIVESTRDNPYKQSEELTIFKADYMQKRYNKTIKVAE